MYQEASNQLPDRHYTFKSHWSITILEYCLIKETIKYYRYSLHHVIISLVWKSGKFYKKKFDAFGIAGTSAQ